MSSAIKIDIHKNKLIVFDLDIQGLNTENLNSRLSIEMNGIEYGFQAEIKGHKVEAIIPCLDEVVCDSKKLKGFLSAKLEMFSENHYYKPWEGKVKVAEPTSVKAKLSDSKQPTVKSIKTEDQDVNEDQEVIVDDPEPENEVDLPKPKEKKKEKPIKESDINEKTKNQYLEKLKSIDMDGIRNYMSNAGTKNESVQNVILEQAENTCKNPDDKFELLKSVVKVMKKIKSGEMPNV